MKKSTTMILNKFPSFEKHMKDYDSSLLSNDTLSKFSSVEQTFLRLAWFFESPEKENFNLESIYNNLSDGWLSFALECIVTFFSEDTYLMKEPDFSFITEESEYLTQVEFVKFLNEHKNKHKKNFSRPMLNTYLKRGVIPEPDLIISENKYWLKKTCQSYLDHLVLSENI